MRKPTPLNEAKAHGWAAVARGWGWKRSTFDGEHAGHVWTSGPVIVWGAKSGEGEDLPRIEAPTPSPLELEATRLNALPSFLAFVRAAHSRVRHSVRWKTSRRAAKRLKVKASHGIYIAQHGLYMNARMLTLASEVAERLGLTISAHASSEPEPVRYFVPKHKKPKCSAGEDKLSDWLMKWCERKGFLADDEDFEARTDDEAYTEALWILGDEIKWLKAESYKIKGSSAFSRKFGKKVPNVWRNDRDDSISRQSDLLKYALLKRDFEALRLLLWRHKVTRIGLSLALRFLEREAFRAYLARRVRPVSRRIRAPRPLYARPRPPTAPLAPPVTC